MKLYRTRTQEQCDWLMQNLEDEGCVWGLCKRKPTDLDLWHGYKEGSVVRVNDENHIGYAEVKFYQENFPDEPIIEVSDLMNKEKWRTDPLAEKVLERNFKPLTVKEHNEAHSVVDKEPEVNDPIKPSHYRKGEIDLYESWYRTYPFNEFRAIMSAIAERYMKRDKNDRIEDIEKARYTLERLKEYEELEEAE